MIGTTEGNVILLNHRSPIKNVLLPRNYIRDRKNYFRIKRVVDCLVSVFVIAFILSWLLPVLALLIKLDSRGPVFFIQKRVGFLGRSFPCFKLRTMVVNKNSDDQQASLNDPRITMIGKFLRITSLDELPQFFNVLLGHMSIVGPRPHMHKDHVDFSQVVRNYRLRHYVRPGITGMAQVKGYRGPATDFQSIFHRYQWDAFYIRNTNLFLDMKIIRLTAAQVVKSIFNYGRKQKATAKIAEFSSHQPALVFAKSAAAAENQ